MPALRNGLSSHVLVTGLTGAFMLTAAPVLLPQMAGLGLVQLAPAHAGVSIGIFYDSLDPHGSWIDHPRYGYVFVPAVSAGWRPYVHGHWIYTKRHGWYWVSDEPFAWAVYHYGRWAYDPVYGWTWVPGNVWAPAWVSWRYGGGYVAWAPIGPYGDGYAYGTPAYYDPPIIEAWVGVPSHRFVAVDVSSYVVPVVEINVILGKASKRHNVRYNKGQVDNPFLSLESAQKLTKADIEVREIKATDDPKQAEAGARKDETEIRTFRAEITKDKPTEKPKQVARTPDEVKSRPTLTETAKGKRPKGAPPSAAELKPVEQGQKAKPDDQRETKGEEKPDGQQPQQQPAKQQPEAGQQKQKQKKDAGPKQDGRPAPQMKQEGAPKPQPEPMQQAPKPQPQQQPEPKQQPQRQVPKPQQQQAPQKPAPEQQGPAQPKPQPKGPAPAQQAPVPPQGVPQGPEGPGGPPQSGPPQGGPPGGGGGEPRGGPPPGGGGPQGGPPGGGGGGAPSGRGGPPDRK